LGGDGMEGEQRRSGEQECGWDFHVRKGKDAVE
jgi:hypothetical protein